MGESAPEMTKLDPPEKRRTYYFPNGRMHVLESVTHFLSRPSSGTHRLKTANGKLWVVHPVEGWAIEIEAADWTL